MEKMCAGKTAKGKPCSFRATQGLFCKKHNNPKNICVPVERTIPDLVYHNHAPNQECGKSCPRFNASQTC